jgi:hypothetical protein
MTRKNADYWQGYGEQAARSHEKEAERAARAALDRAALDAIPNLADLANEVARHLAHDHGRKQIILARSPHIFGSMDAAELGAASARELAARELKELGIEVGDADPVQLLDAHHAGRQFARGVTPMSGGPILGGKPADMFNPLGSASDAREGGSCVDKYLAGASDARESDSLLDKYLAGD